MNEQVIQELTANTENMLSVEKNILEVTAEFRKQLKTYQDKDRELREALYTAMKDSGTKSFENDLLKLVYVAPTSRKTLDSKRLQEELPELYADYVKESPVKGSVRITVKTATKRVDI